MSDGRPGAGESGFTLIELLVAMALSLFIGAGAMTFMVVTFEQQNDISSRAVATDQAELGLEQLVRDLREATTGLSISTSSQTTTISFTVPAPGTAGSGSDSLVWTCTGSTSTPGSCSRVLTPTSGGTVTRTEISGLESLTVTPYGSGDPPAALTLPITGATNVSAVALTANVQITSYGRTRTTVATNPSTRGFGDTNPIVLQATADLRNFA